MEKLPKISIITPSLNQGQFIERTILSVLNQDYPNIEYIVMDGGSTDNTTEVLKKYVDRLTWKSEPDRGQSDAINKGFRMATGDIIGWLNSDDMYRPGALFTIAEYFIDHPDVGMVYGDCNHIDVNDNHIGFFKAEPFNLKRYLNEADIIPQQSTFFRKRVLEKADYLDPSLHYAMDLDLFLRIARDHKVKYIPVHIGSYRVYRGAKSKSDDISVIKNYYREINKVVRQQGAMDFNRRLINQKWQILRWFILKYFVSVDTPRRDFIKKYYYIVKPRVKV